MKDDDRMIRYLLGDLPEADQLSIEEEYFQNDQAYEDLRAFEDDLMYAYLGGTLASQYREKFEHRFLASENGRRKLEFAKSLNDKIFRNMETPVWKPRPTANLFLSVAAILVVATITWLILQTAGLRVQLREILTKQSTIEKEWQRERIQLEKKFARDVPVSLTFLLTSGSVRDSGEIQRLVIPPVTGMVNLHMVIGKGRAFKSFRAVLRNANGEEIWSQDTGPNSILKVPSKILARDDYELTLWGDSGTGDFEEIADYYFTVVR